VESEISKKQQTIKTSGNATVGVKQQTGRPSKKILCALGPVNAFAHNSNARNNGEQLKNTKSIVRRREEWQKLHNVSADVSLICVTLTSKARATARRTIRKSADIHSHTTPRK